MYHGHVWTCCRRVECYVLASCKRSVALGAHRRDESSPSAAALILSTFSAELCSCLILRLIGATRMRNEMLLAWNWDGSARRPRSEYPGGSSRYSSNDSDTDSHSCCCCSVPLSLEWFELVIVVQWVKWLAIIIFNLLYIFIISIKVLKKINKLFNYINFNLIIINYINRIIMIFNIRNKYFF